jgi:hypothetical protein
MAGSVHLRDPRILTRVGRTNMKRRMGKAVAAWEDDGGASRPRSNASAVRSRNQAQASKLTEGKPVPLEIRSGDRIVPGKYSSARMTTVSGKGKL